MLKPAVSLAAAFACLPVVAAHAADPVRIESLSGAAAEPLRFEAGVRAAVFVFVSVDCPISNRYAPEVRRLHDTFGTQGVKLTLVYPNPAEGAAAIRGHLKDYSYPVDALRDPRQAFAKHAGVTITLDDDGGGDSLSPCYCLSGNRCHPYYCNSGELQQKPVQGGTR